MTLTEAISELRAAGNWEHPVLGILATEIADMLEAIMDKYIDAMRDLEMARADNKRLRAVLAEIAQEFRPGYIDVPTVAGAKAKRGLEITL